MSERARFLRFLVFLAALIALFFWPVLTGSVGYYYGDYKMQFLPWAKVLDASLRQFSLPLWTDAIGCGFPLLAEGQCGALHPVNWLVTLLLPFPASFNASIVILFVAAGIGTYLFSRATGSGAAGASMACLAFLFGSAYAGLFYGLPALRTLAWFPWILFYAERLRESRRRVHAAAMALAVALSFLGGFPQLAVYAVVAAALYFTLASAPVERRPVPWRSFALGIAVGIGLAAVQILPTLELLTHTARAGAGESFAFQKSMNPANVATLAWPGFGLFLGFDFYIGVVPLVLALYALTRGDRPSWVLAALAAFFVLLAFGQYNPIYVWAVRALRLYAFRVPAKFLFFACFFLSVLAGRGVDRLERDDPGARRRFFVVALTSAFAAFAAFAAAHWIARAHGQEILAWAERHVQEKIFGQPGHVKTMNEYSSSVRGYFSFLVTRTAFLDRHFLVTAAVWIAALGLACARKLKTPLLVAALLLLTVADLYRYMELGTGFRGNRAPASDVAPDATASYLAGQGRGYRTYEPVILANRPQWLPNSNLLFGSDSAGIYTPLAIGAYAKYTEPLGLVDDASGIPPTTPQAVTLNASKLAFMNVRHVLSRAPLDVPRLRREMSGKSGDTVYSIDRAWPRSILLSTATAALTGKALYAAPPATGRLLPSKDAPRDTSWQVRAGENDSVLFVSRLDYPGWRAFVDGRKQPIVPVDGIFQSVRVPAGEHKVELYYLPLSFYAGLAVSGSSVLAAALLARPKRGRS